MENREESMKKTILAFTAVLVVALLAISCGGGGGNITKVKNGVFSSYDASITVGKALENNPNLKGGKWAAIEMNGRNYVTYTVNFSREQIQQFLPSAFDFNIFFGTLSSTTANYPNVACASLFRRHLLSPSFESSMSTEEIDQVKKILSNALTGPLSEAQYNNLDENPLLTVDGFEGIISFVMNEDGSFNTNMVEWFTTVTLRCFNNLKVRFGSSSFTTQATILKNCVYNNDFIPEVFAPYYN
jgi:hypothetical protein